MAVPSAPTSSTVILQTGNGQNLLTWPIISGATSYFIQRSTDGVNFSPLTFLLLNSYLDTSVSIGTNYYYQVAASNSSGTSAYTPSLPASIVPCSPGQMNLGYIRYLSQLRSDQLNGQFLTVDEWNSNINQSAFELYDILVTKFGDDYFMAPFVTFQTTGAQSYPLPDGVTSIGGSVPSAMYKLIGVDCGVAVGNNAWVTLPRFNWIDRNKFIYPQLQANALGVFNLSYREMGNNLFFIPQPSAGQYIRLSYVPVLSQMLQDTDMLPFSISGWSEYVIVDAAIKAAIKEESYELVQALSASKAALLERIETTAANRDVGQPNTISDTRSNTGFYDGGGFGGSGHGMAGWAVLLFPGLSKNNIGYGSLIHSIFTSQVFLAYTAVCVFISYLFYIAFRKFGGRIGLPGASDHFSRGVSSFFNHIRMVFRLGALKKMIRPNTRRVVAFVAYGHVSLRRSIVNLVRKPVRSSSCPSSSGSSNILKNNSTVTLAVHGTNPQPTRIRFFNLLPKAFFHWFHVWSRISDSKINQGGLVTMRDKSCH